MIQVRGRALLAAAVISALTLSACDSDDPESPPPVTTPTPVPTPPAPSGPTFTVSGTVSETAPTTSTRVPEAEAQLSGGVATGSVGDGTFTIPNVANGSYTLRVAKAGYETATQTVTVSGAAVSGIQVNLLPVFRWVDQEFYHQLGPGSAAACPGLTDGRQPLPLLLLQHRSSMCGRSRPGIRPRPTSTWSSGVAACASNAADRWAKITPGSCRTSTPDSYAPSTSCR